MTRSATHTRPVKQRGGRAAVTPLDIAAVLTAAEVSPTHILQILQRYGSAVERVVRSSPYRLTRDIEGLLFAAVDRLAQQLGHRKGEPQRVQAGIQAILQQGLRSGHTWVPLT